MQSAARENYLQTEVLTAKPQKLQLMLIDAALRNGQMARELWKESRDDAACEALIRAQQIAGQLLCGLNPERDPELVRRVASVYLFIFRSLSDAALHRDEAKLEAALKVLEVERETWRQLCDLLANEPAPQSSLGDLVA